MRSHLRVCMGGLLLLGLTTTLPILADVTAVADTGFISEHQLQLQATPLQAYRALTEDVRLWWDAQHSYSGEASHFSIDARPGGCFCERWATGGVEHMRVVYAVPGAQLNLVGGLGPLQGMGVSGTMSFRFAANDQGTLLQYRYAVSGFTPGGLQAMAEPVDQVQLGQLLRLQRYLEQQQP